MSRWTTIPPELRDRIAGDIGGGGFPVGKCDHDHTHPPRAFEYPIPVKTVSETNMREHWSQRHKRRKHQRTFARATTWEILRQRGVTVSLPVTITLTRVGGRQMDSDNLGSSAKGVRDGIADALGVDDGSSEITWVYAQRRGKPRGVHVEIMENRSEADLEV